MKKTKVIIPALGILLLSTAASVTGTVAWFSANVDIDVSSMSISAKTVAPFLLASDTQNGTYDTSVSVSASASNLLLVTPLNVASNVDYYATATAKQNGETTTPTKFTNIASVLWGSAYSSQTGDPESANVTTLVASANVNKYVLMQEIWFKVADNSVNGSNLSANSATFNAGTNSIADSGRALIISEEGKYQLFELANGEVTSKTGDAALYSEITTTAKKVTICFYFDGTDEAAYTANATDLSAVTASFAFGIDNEF